jgi:hypothetical protein
MAINFFKQTASSPGGPRKTRSDKGRKRTGSKASQSLASERDKVRQTRSTLESGKSKLSTEGQKRVQGKIDQLTQQSKALNSGLVQERRSVFIGNNQADLALTNPVARSGKLQSAMLKGGVGRQVIEKAKQARDTVKQELIKKAKQFRRK